MVVGSTQPVTEMSTRSLPGGKGGRCVGLTTLPPSFAIFKKSGNLIFLEPSGSLQACNGTALPLPLPYYTTRMNLYWDKGVLLCCPFRTFSYCSVNVFHPRQHSWAMNSYCGHFFSYLHMVTVSNVACRHSCQVFVWSLSVMWRVDTVARCLYGHCQ
jgi:hypothetical protein